MKQTISKLSLILFLGNLLLLSCRKHDELVKPAPQNPPPVLSHSFQLTLDSLPGEPKAPISNLFAVVSAVNEKNEPVLTNSPLALDFDGKFKTAEVKLVSGNFRITKFLIVNEKNQVRFATPIINSAKAGLVSKPLPVSFILPQPVVLGVGIEVARVEATDKPESFGYPAGTFNHVPGNPNDPTPEQPGTIRIKMRIAIQVGAISYDSIPGTILYTTWDETQQTSGKYITLAGGINDLTLDKKVVKHHFRMTKWGKSYELTLLKTDIKEGTLYMIGGATEAKKLRSEITYKLVNGTYVAESKNSYMYQDGKLSGIDYYLRKADNKPYLAMHDAFQYSNGKLQRINRFDEKNQASGYTTFTYDGAGRVNSISESRNNIKTDATVSYFHSAEEGSTDVSLNYTFSNSSATSGYFQRFFRGNRWSDVVSKNNNFNVTGQYDYDHNINPYAHMGWLNLSLSNQSKNNVVVERKQYFGNYPEAYLFQIEYKYDAEAYPIEVVRHYKSYSTSQILYTTKTVFTY